MSSIKGYPTTQKLVNGVPSVLPQYATVQPTDGGLRASIDSSRFAFRVGGTLRTAGAGTGNPSDGSPTQIVDTSTPARVGDFVRFTSGLAIHLEIPIVAVQTNAIQLGVRVPTNLAPTSGDTFYIMRYVTQVTDESGSQIVVASPGPSEFVLDGSSVQVEEDTVTPGNSNPFPVKLLNSSGVEVAPLTDAQLRASPVGVSASSLPLPTGAATEATLSSIDTKTPALVTGRVPVDGSGVTQPISAASLPLPTGAATEATLGLIAAAIGEEAQPVPANVMVVGGRDNGDVYTLHVGSNGRARVHDPELGSSNDAAASSDTGNFSLIALFKRSLERLSDLIALFPTSIGQQNAAGSLSVVPASDYTPPAQSVPAAVTVKQAALTVGATAVRLTHDGSAPSATRRKLQFLIEPGGADNFFMGSSSVTSSGSTRGVRLYPGTLYTFDNDANDYYIISDTAAQTVFVVEAE